MPNFCIFMTRTDGFLSGFIKKIPERFPQRFHLLLAGLCVPLCRPKFSSCFFQNGQNNEIRKGGDCPRRTLRWEKGRHHQKQWRRNDRQAVRARSRCRRWKVPEESHPPHVQETRRHQVSHPALSQGPLNFLFIEIRSFALIISLFDQAMILFFRVMW